MSKKQFLENLKLSAHLQRGKKFYEAQDMDKVYEISAFNEMLKKADYSDFKAMHDYMKYIGEFE